MYLENIAPWKFALFFIGLLAIIIIALIIIIPPFVKEENKEIHKEYDIVHSPLIPIGENQYIKKVHIDGYLYLVFISGRGITVVPAIRQVGYKLKDKE